MASFQEQKQKIVLEHLLSSDRNGLLTEIQDLQAQLRLMHLQSQEKLQQLQETLINTENHGSKQEHQLRRQGNILDLCQVFITLYCFTQLKIVKHIRKTKLSSFYKHFY